MVNHECSDPDCKLGIMKSMTKFAGWFVAGVLIVFVICMFALVDSISCKMDKTELPKLNEVVSRMEVVANGMEMNYKSNRELILRHMEENKAQMESISRAFEAFDKRLDALEGHK